MLNVIHIKTFLQSKLIVKPHSITSVQTQKRKGHKTRQKKERILFFWQLKATARSVTKPQIKGLNTEL